MTFEDRQLIGFEDIVGIQYECLHCKAKLILPISNVQRAPKKCANCNEDWFGGQMERGDDRFNEFLAAFKGVSGMVNLLKNISNLKITMEVASHEDDEFKDA